MKKSLLLLGVIAALAIGAPAHSQYIYMDVNGDGVCTSADLLTSSSTSIDVWLNTNHDANGSVKTCSSNASQPLDIFSYDLVVHQAGSGSVGFTSCERMSTRGLMVVRWLGPGWVRWRRSRAAACRSGMYEDTASETRVVR